MTALDGPHTLGGWLSSRAVTSPDAIAIDDRGVRISYAELEARAGALAVRLAEAGYGPGGRIATVSGNSIEHVVAFFACARSGIAFVPLSWRLSPRELAALVERARPDLVLVEDEYAGLARDALVRLPVPPPTAALGTTGVEAHVPSIGGPRAARRAVRDDDPLLIIFTSGSEAEPKGVVLTHANCFWNNLALAGAVQLTAEDVVLSMLPQFHIAAWNCQPLLAWWVGATVVLERSFQPRRILQLIAERGVTAMMGVPTQYRLLMDDPGFRAVGHSALRTALVGGATLTPEIAAGWEAAGIPLTQGYGLTEASPNVLCAGRPYPTVEVRLIDVETQLPLAGVASGELWVRGPSIFAGYLDDPEATARALADGWLRTGDIAARDAEGLVRIVDRKKDIYISGGENVAPAEVERALMRHPAVREAAVVGVPDPVWGERGVAFVVAAEGAACSEDELRAHAKEHLAGFKVPSRVVFVEELPRSTIEKVARVRLRDRARALTEGARHEQR